MQRSKCLKITDLQHIRLRNNFYGRISERSKLESALDLLKNRSGCHSDRFFSGGILCKKDHEASVWCESSAGRNPYTAVGAAAVIAFPLMYRNARAAFEQVDVNLIYAGQTLGMSDSRIFWRVVMPAAGPGIASGTVLAFARAIGEYGATSMLAGNILGKTRTVSVAIAAETAAGNYGIAGFWVVVIVLISFVIVALINIVSGRGMKTRRWI